MTTEMLHQRRYDLDWLRIIAFAILIFYHIGMFYVTWGWHVKSPHMNTEPQMPMMLTNAWRLALLFFISGVAVRFASTSKPVGRFALERLWRLGIPLIFGMAVVVAPQTYFQLRQGGEIESDFWSFYVTYLSFEDVFSVTTPTWNHLWYVVYVLLYTLMILPLAAFMKRGEGDRLMGAILGAGSVWRLLLLLPIPFVIYRFTLNPYFETTHNLVWDWANHAHSFTIFVIGFLAAKSSAFWTAVRRAMPMLLVAVPVMMVVFNWAWQEDTLNRIAETPYLPFLQAARIFYAWFVIVLLASLAMRFLNHDSAARRYLTEAIFPYYILHQTITVSAGYYLAQMDLSAWEEFAWLSLATIGGCAVLHEILIRRIWFLRPLFGLKPKGT